MQTIMSNSAVLPVRSTVHHCFFLFLISLLLLGEPTSATSYVTVFSDSACKTSFNDWEGPNGYPDGVCTSFSEKAGGRFSSFMINELDQGCTGKVNPLTRKHHSTNPPQVTIYTPDTTDNPCSGTATLATPYHCYNSSSSYPYYSIDNCTPPDQRSSSSSSSTPSSTASPTSSSSSKTTTPTGTIIGASVGGAVALIACIAGAWWWFSTRRRRRQQREEEKEAAGEVEAPGQGGKAAGGEKCGNAAASACEIGGAPILEMSAEEGARFELPGREEAGEEKGDAERGGRREPVELPGDEGWRGAVGEKGG